MKGCVATGTGGKESLSRAQTLLPGVYHQEAEYSKSRQRTSDPRGCPRTAISTILKVCGKAEVNDANLRNSAGPRSWPATVSAECVIGEALECLSWSICRQFGAEANDFGTEKLFVASFGQERL